MREIVHVLTYPHKVVIERDNGLRETVYEEALLRQLADAVTSSGKSDGAGRTRSTTPLDLYALDMMRDIERAWRSDGLTLDESLWQLANAQHDELERHRLTQALQQVADDIRNLFVPQRRFHLTDNAGQIAKCPACSSQVVRRKDNTGEYVREPALLLTTLGCVCQACREHWPPERLEHLALVLNG